MIRQFIAGIATFAFLACASANSQKQSLNRQLILAAEKGRTQEVIALIRAGADIEACDAEGFTPYLAASSNGRLETMRLLKGLGAKTMVDDKFQDARFFVKSH